MIRRAGLALLLLLLSVFAFTQDKPFTAVTNVTAIEVTAEVVDASGRTPADLKPADFAIVEDGVERKVVALEYVCAQCAAAPAAPASGITAATPAAPAQAAPAVASNPWDILIYIDYELSSRTTIRDAVRTLTTEAERLTRQGRVEVVVADPKPRRLLAPTTDAKAVGDALAFASKINARSQLANVRRAFLNNSSDRENASEESYSNMGDVRSSIAEESALIQHFMGRLSGWLGGYPRSATRALFLVADGFDVDPSDFYGETMAPSLPTERHSQQRVATGSATPQDLAQQKNRGRARIESGKLASESMGSSDRREYHPLAQQAAAAGWTIVSLRGGLNSEMAAESSMGSGNNVVSNFLGGGGGTGGPSRGLQHRQVEALAAFAEATGGSLVADTTKFGKAIDTLSRRIRLTYQVDRPVDGLVRPIEVTSRRAGLTVNAARYVSSSTPELVATSRASSLIEGANSNGELPVVAKLQLDPGKRGESPKGTLEARASLAALAPLRAQLRSAAVRVTIGVSAGNEQPRIIHQLHPNFDLSQLSNATFTSPIQLPKNTDKLAVVIEELSTGAWGGAVLPIARNQETIATAGWTEGSADPMPWVAYEAALQQAQSGRKLIVQCSGCDQKLFADSTLRNTLGAFIVTQKADPQPRVLLLDPWGRIRFEWKPANAPELVAKLRQAQALAPTIIHAGSLGETAEAHLALGFAYLKAQAYGDAQREYDLAEETARAKGDLVVAQRAQIQSAAALAQSGKRDAAITSLEKIVKTPQSPATEAEAWLILGHLRKSAGNAKAAKEAYTNAAARAPEGSELQRIAKGLAGGV